MARNGPPERRVLVEREMRARVQVVREVVAEHSLQPRRVGDDDVVEALTSDRPDHTLDVSILSGRPRRSSNLLDVHTGDRGCHRCEERIAIMLGSG